MNNLKCTGNNQEPSNKKQPQNESSHQEEQEVCKRSKTMQRTPTKIQNENAGIKEKNMDEMKEMRHRPLI